MIHGGTSEDRYEDLLASHLENTVTDEMVSRWRDIWLSEGVVKVREICPPALRREFDDEAERLLRAFSVRQDLKLPTTGNSPRKMITVRRTYINAHGNIIPSLYRSRVLMNFLSRITGEPVVLCPFDDEQFVISCLQEPDDTHGWHWDDYSFGLVWIIESPPVEMGGFIQCVPNTQWDKQDPRLHEVFVNNPIRSYDMASGDLYFLRSDTTLHRVYPLQGPTRRVIVNMAWASISDLDRSVTHETTDVIYTDLSGPNGRDGSATAD